MAPVRAQDCVEAIGRQSHSRDVDAPKRREALDGERPVRSRAVQVPKEANAELQAGELVVWREGARRVRRRRRDDPDPENLPTRLKLTEALRGRQLGGMGHLGIDPDVNIRRIEARVSAGRSETKQTCTPSRGGNFFIVLLLSKSSFVVSRSSSRASSSRGSAVSRAR